MSAVSGDDPAEDKRAGRPDQIEDMSASSNRSGRNAGGTPLGRLAFWNRDDELKRLASQDINLQRPGRHGVSAGESVVYRTYKRRWFGLAQMVLMNIIVSWDVSLRIASPI